MADFLRKLDSNNIPKHIAIIMDGNGRWAKERNLPRIMGHKSGTDNINNIVTAADDIGVKYLTLYTFSIENKKRPPEEVSALMDLFEIVLEREFPEMMSKGVKLKAIGNLDEIRPSTKKSFLEAIAKSNKNKGVILSIAINYGGRDELLRAFKKIISNVENKTISVERISEKTINQNLDTYPAPDPEMLIRTSGELRISNFLLYQSAYTELIFIKKLWPDFRPEDLYEAIYDYQKRDRRFGEVS